MIKEVGNSLMDGRELANITLPIQLFEAKSFLEKMTEGWAYAPTYLTRAAHIFSVVVRLQGTLDIANNTRSTGAVQKRHHLRRRRHSPHPCLPEAVSAVFHITS